MEIPGKETRFGNELPVHRELLEHSLVGKPEDKPVCCMAAGLQLTLLPLGVSPATVEV